MYYIVFTMYQLYQHQIKTVQIAFHLNILFKSHPVIKQFTVRTTSQPPSPEKCSQIKNGH